MSVWGILVAAGSGTRFGKAKQFEIIAGKRVMVWSFEHLRAATDGVVVVLPASEADGWFINDPTVSVVAGGATRSESVRAGLAAVPQEATIVLVHDAARPLATPALANSTIQAIRNGAHAAIPGVPISDTIKRVDTSTEPPTVLETVKRDDLCAVQTPQAFDAAFLRRAHATEADATDDAALVERIGGRVVIVPGESRNMKITVADDLAVAEVLITQ